MSTSYIIRYADGRPETTHSTWGEATEVAEALDDGAEISSVPDKNGDHAVYVDTEHNVIAWIERHRA